MARSTLSTVLECASQKYLASSMDDDMNVFVYISNSPEARNGCFPPTITLCDLSILSVGCLNGLSVSKLLYVSELDLTDNLLSDWHEVSLLLRRFPNLCFLNVSNNLLNCTLDKQHIVLADNGLKRLALNGNQVDWVSISHVVSMLSCLEELHLSFNDLANPKDNLRVSSKSLRCLHLSGNNISDLGLLASSLEHCVNLQVLSLAECPIQDVPLSLVSLLGKLVSLNLSRSQIGSFEDVEVLRKMPSLRELRLQHCPLLAPLTHHERRMVLVARLPNVQVLNGGTRIEEAEREDAERAFIRRHLQDEPLPQRVTELMDIHGKLEPLINVDLAPETRVQVLFTRGDSQREEILNVYQSVAQIKAKVGQWFHLAPQNIRLFYCDQDLVSVAGPEEMKWPQKALYTYNVRNGDHFIVDEKVQLSRLRTSSRGSGSSLASSTSPATCSRPYTFRMTAGKSDKAIRRDLFKSDNT